MVVGLGLGLQLDGKCKHDECARMVRELGIRGKCDDDECGRMLN